MEPLDLTRAHQSVRFERAWVPVIREEAHCFTAVTGMRAGTREAMGDFYALAWRDAEDQWHRILDPLAMSLPFGVMAPAELYDVDAMQAARRDRAYFEALKGDAPHKFGPPVNILQIHVPTATAGGTLASLTRHFQRLAERVARDLPLEPADKAVSAAMTRCSFCRWSRRPSTRPARISGTRWRATTTRWWSTCCAPTRRTGAMTSSFRAWRR